MSVTRGPFTAIWTCSLCGPTNRFLDVQGEDGALRVCIACHPRTAQRFMSNRHTTPDEWIPARREWVE